MLSLRKRDIKLFSKVLRRMRIFIRMQSSLKALTVCVVPGEWIQVKGSNGKDYHKCSKCLHTQEITGVKNYCAVCGARMKGGAE